MSRVEMKKVKTCELVNEIETREGVEKKIIGPYQMETVSVEGPAVILVITD